MATTTKGTKQIRIGRVHRYMQVLENEINTYLQMYRDSMDKGNRNGAIIHRAKAEALKVQLHQMQELFPAS